MKTLLCEQLNVSDESFHGWQPISLAHEKDMAESRRVGRAIRAGAKQCWFNARKAVLRLSDYADAAYVEGWANVEGMAIEHGWVVKDGVVVDPTLPDYEVVYFPGLEFQGRHGIQEFLASERGKGCKKSPFFFAFGWGGHLSPSFHQASTECWNHVVARFASREGEIKV